MTTSMRRRLRAEDDGLSLVEMMVALLILGVVLSALAGALITSLQAIVGTERQTRANQLGNELLEELQSLPWATVGLYAGEVASAPQFGGTTTFESEDVVVLPDATPRDPRVPRAVETVTSPNGSTYDVRRAITWANDGDGYYKRFVIELSWSERGRERTLRVAAMRAPTPADEVSAFAAELTVDESDVEYDSTGESANPPALVFTAIFDADADLSPTLTWDDNGTPVPVAATLMAQGGRRVWKATVSTTTAPWPTGDVVFTVRGTRGDLVAEASTTVSFSYAGEPPTISVTSVVLSHDSPGESPICVWTSGDKAGEPTSPLHVDVDIHGLGSSDKGRVAVSWTGQATPLIADHHADTDGGAVFRLTVNNDYGFPLPVGSAVEFRVFVDEVPLTSELPVFVTKGGSCV